MLSWHVFGTKSPKIVSFFAFKGIGRVYIKQKSLVSIKIRGLKATNLSDKVAELPKRARLVATIFIS